MSTQAPVMRTGRHGPYTAAQFAFGVNLAGNAVGAAGFPIFVLETTGSLALTGWVVTASIVGSTIAGFLAGPLIDRVGMRRSWLLSIVFGTATTVLIYVLHLMGILTPWLLLGLTFLRGSADEPGRVSTFGILPALATQVGHKLERANATLRAMNAVANIVGPIVAGSLIGLVGSQWTLVVDAMAGLIAALVLASIPALIVERNDGSDSGNSKKRETYRKQLMTAVRFFWYDRLLRTMIISTTILATLDTGVGTIGLTAYADDILGDAAWYGGLVSAFGLGSLVGTIGYGTVGHRLPRRATYLATYLGFAVLLLLLTVQVQVPIALTIMFVAGIVVSPIDLLYILVLQERVPQRMFGSVTSIAMTIVSCPGPIGVAMLTWLLTQAGTFAAFVVLGLCYLVITVALFFARPLHDLRELRRREPERAA